MLFVSTVCTAIAILSLLTLHKLLSRNYSSAYLNVDDPSARDAGVGSKRFHGIQDGAVASAATDVPVKVVLHFLLAGPGIFVQQPVGGHAHSSHSTLSTG